MGRRREAEAPWLQTQESVGIINLISGCVKQIKAAVLSRCLFTCPALRGDFRFFIKFLIPSCRIKS